MFTKAWGGRPYEHPYHQRALEQPGDEAALRAVVDFLRRKLPGAKVKVQLVCNNVRQYPYLADQVPLIENYPAFRHLLEVPLAFLSGGRLAVSRAGRDFFRALREADVVIHAPGGPNIGDVYARAERPYLLRLLAVVWQQRPLFFWAPSLGPFENRGRNLLRRFIFNRAAFICTREEISAAAVRGLGVCTSVESALDAVFLGMTVCWMGIDFSPEITNCRISWPGLRWG